jgi:hypothetical protein
VIAGGQRGLTTGEVWAHLAKTYGPRDDLGALEAARRGGVQPRRRGSELGGGPDGAAQRFAYALRAAELWARALASVVRP